MIRDNFVVEFKMEVYFVEKECCYSFGSDCFLSGVENYLLCKAMVNHNQQRVKTRGRGEIGDQVTQDLLEGVRGVGFDWGEWWDSGVCV